MKEIVLDDFSGGLLEQVSPFDFSKRQVSVAKGFVLDNEQVLRSQWAVQYVGGLTNIKAIAAIGDIGRDFLVALRTDGTLWWCEAPARFDSDAETAAFAGWTQLTQATDVLTDELVPVVADPVRSLLCEIPLAMSETEYRTGLLVNSLNGVGDPLVIYRKKVAGVETLVANLYTRRFPSLYEGNADGDPMVGGGFFYAVGETMPRANVGVMWKDYLCLADCEWYRNAVNQKTGAEVPLGADLAQDLGWAYNITPANVAGTWIFSNSEMTASASVEMGPAGSFSTVLGVVAHLNNSPDFAADFTAATYDDKIVIDARTGTLSGGDPGAGIGSRSAAPVKVRNAKRYKSAFWASHNDESGIVDATTFHPDKSMNFGFLSPEARIMSMQEVQAGLLLFTTPTHSGSDGIVLLRGTPTQYTVEVVRGNIGLVSGDADDVGHRYTTAFWPELDAICFVEQNGQVWHTDGQRTDRIDRAAFRGVTRANPADHTVALRGYLFVSRHGRLFCQNLIATEGGADHVAYGCWTELVTPYEGTQVTATATVEDSLYFVQGGELFRFQMAETHPRGTIDGGLVDLTLASAPVVADGPAARGRWARVGVRAHSPSNAGTLVSVTSHAGSVLASPAPVGKTTVLNRDLSGLGQVVEVLGHGPSNTACVSATFQGDVVVETLSLSQHGRHQQRSYGTAGLAGDA